MDIIGIATFVDFDTDGPDVRPARRALTMFNASCKAHGAEVSITYGRPNAHATIRSSVATASMVDHLARNMAEVQGCSVRVNAFPIVKCDVL